MKVQKNVTVNVTLNIIEQAYNIGAFSIPTVIPYDEDVTDTLDHSYSVGLNATERGLPDETLELYI